MAKASPDPDAKQQAKQRAEKVRDAAAGRVGNGKRYVHPTPFGNVEINELTYHSDEAGQAWIEVHTAADNLAGDPHFRIVNPPTLAEDAAGDVEVGGRRYRDDPLAAVAQVIAGFGAATRPKGRPR